MDHTMNGGSAVAFFCFSLRIQPFYPFQIVVLVEGEIEGRVSIASRAFVYTNAILLCKMLVGLCPIPICSASCRCRRRVCSKHFYNKKDSPRVLPCGKNSRLRCKSLSFQHGHRLRGAAAPGWEKNFHRLHRGRGCTGRDHGAEVGVRLPHLQ